MVSLANLEPLKGVSQSGYSLDHTHAERLQIGRFIYFGASMLFYTLVVLLSLARIADWGITPEWIRTLQILAMLGFGLYGTFRAIEITDDLRRINRDLGSGPINPAPLV